MTTSIIAACLWVLLGAVTAALPMRRQMVPGLFLLVTALPLMVWIGYENGWHWSLIGLMAFVSMFRRPLVYLIGRLSGKETETPG